MHILRKILNKLNGNLCFTAESDSSYYIFECDRENQNVSYVTSTQSILDICNNSLGNYLVCFGNDQLGLFDGTTLNETYSTSPTTTDLIIYGQTPSSDNNFYIWSKIDNTISRIELVGAVASTIWTYDLPFDFTACQDAQMFFKKFNDSIIFKGLGKILSIRDLGTSAVIMESTDLINNNFVTTSGDNYPFVSYARTRQVYGRDLENTSSSSSSSSSSSTSSSSESSESIGNTTSSSSESSESVGNESSSSSSGSTSSSESSGAFYDDYCVEGCYIQDANGSYYRYGTYAYEHPTYTNGSTYMFMHVYDGTLEWVIEYAITDGTPGLYYKLLLTQTPEGTDWSGGVTVSIGECSSSSSSSSEGA